MRKLHLVWVSGSIFFIALAAGTGCGSDSSSGGSGGAAGSSAGGAAGASSGGSAGSSTGGTGGTGGSAGSSTGGSGGSGGTAGSSTGGSAGSSTGGTAGSASGGSAGSSTGGTAGASGSAGAAGAGGCGGSTPVALTVKNISAWCDVTVAGGSATALASETVCVATGQVDVTAVAHSGFKLGTAPWHKTDGDTGNGDQGTISGTGQTAMSSTTETTSGGTDCVWVCCDFNAGGGCNVADPCL